MDPETVKRLRITGIGIGVAALLTTCVFGRKTMQAPEIAAPASATAPSKPTTPATPPGAHASAPASGR